MRERGEEGEEWVGVVESARERRGECIVVCI